MFVHLRLAALAAFVALAAAPAAVAQASFLSPASSGLTGLSAEQQRYLDAAVQSVGYLGHQLVALDGAALSTGRVTLSLPGVPYAAFETERYAARAEGATWSGQGADVLTRALVVVRGDMATGALSADGRSFSLRPLTGGLHALVEFDPLAAARRTVDDAVPSDPTRAAAAPPGGLEANGVEGAERVPGSLTMVDILIVFTPQAVAAFSDPLGVAQFLVEQTNVYYANSGIEMRLRLAGIHNTSTDTVTDDLVALTNPSDGLYDEVHDVRDRVGADLVAMIVRPYAACGGAHTNASAEMAFSVTSVDCTLEVRTFAHEVGHNVGAQHDTYADGSHQPPHPNPYFDYGHGMVNLAERWVTIVAYHRECDEQIPRITCTSIPYFSTPNPVFNGQPTGDAALRDNARVHNERAATIAAFRAALLPAEAAVSPGTLHVTLAPDATTTRTLTVANGPGRIPLYWSGAVVDITDGTGTPLPLGCTEGQLFEQPVGNSTYPYGAGGPGIGQSFQMPCRGTLRSIGPELAGANAPGTWSAAGTLRLYAGEDTDSTEVGAGPFSIATTTRGYRDIAVTSSHVAYPGDVLTWFLDFSSGRLPMIFDEANPYAGGKMYVSGNGSPGGATPVAGNDIRFRARLGVPVQWVMLAQGQGETASGASSSVGVTFDATGLPVGTYTATLQLTTTDPDRETINVPITLTVGTPSSAFAFVQPAAGHVYNAGGWLKAIWDSPASAPADVVLSLRKGTGPYTVIYTGPNLQDDGDPSTPGPFGAARYLIPVGTPAGDDYSLRIEDADSPASFAVSDAFTISDPRSRYVVTSPVAGTRVAAGASLDVTWTAPAPSSGLPVTLALVHRATGAPVVSLQTPDDGAASITVPTDAARGPYAITLTDSGNAGYTGRSGLLKIVPVAVSSPQAGGTYSRGATLPIRWAAPSITDPAAAVRITIKHPSLPTRLVAAQTENDGAFDYTLPMDLAAAGGYFVNVRIAEGGSAAGGVSGTFTVGAPLVLPSPTARFVPAALWDTDASTLVVSAPGLADGAEVGAFWGERLVGAGVVRDGAAEVLVRGSLLVPSLVIDGVPSADDFVWLPEGAALTLRTFAGGVEASAETVGALAYAEGTEASVTIAGDRAQARAASFAVEGVRPNPSSSQAVVRFTSASAQPAMVVVYDLLGRTVATAFSGEAAAGINEVTVPTRALAPGVYVVRVTAGAESAAMRFTVLR